MNDQDLITLAQNAIEHVFRYQTSLDKTLTESHKAVIESKIKELLPLKSHAADHDVANLEIVSDAAMSFLYFYNNEHPEDQLSHKWFYISVQALISIHLKPALVSGEVMRLQALLPQTAARTEEPSASDRNDEPQLCQTEEDLPPGAAPVVADHETLNGQASEGDQAPRDELDEPDQRASDGDYEPSAARDPKARKRRSDGPSVAKGKEPWDDEEIGELIKMKIQGLTHKEAGARLGRTEPACAIRHSIVLKETRWWDFAQEYRKTTRALGETSGVEAENEEGQKDEVATADKETTAVDAQHLLPPGGERPDDDDLGRTYYVGHKTKSTSPDRPNASAYEDMQSRKPPTEDENQQDQKTEAEKVAAEEQRAKGDAEMKEN